MEEDKLLKYNNLNDNEWPNWSIGKISNSFVTLEGQHIQRILNKIHIQLVRLFLSFLSSCSSLSYSYYSSHSLSLILLLSLFFFFFLLFLF